MQIGKIYSFSLDLHVQQKKLVTKSQKKALNSRSRVS